MFYKLCTRKCARIAPKTILSGLFYVQIGVLPPSTNKAPTISRGGTIDIFGW